MKSVMCTPYPLSFAALRVAWFCCLVSSYIGYKSNQGIKDPNALLSENTWQFVLLAKVRRRVLVPGSSVLVMKRQYGRSGCPDENLASEN